MLLHQRANHADQKINMRVMTPWYEISGKNHICSVKTFSSRGIIYPPENKFIGAIASSMLA